jgi:hypothetical protein
MEPCFTGVERGNLGSRMDYTKSIGSSTTVSVLVMVSVSNLRNVVEVGGAAVNQALVGNSAKS